MELVSFRSVAGLLFVLSFVVCVVTNVWRHGNIDLTGRNANVRGVYKRSIIVGVILAAVLRANIIDIFQNPDVPAILFGWLSFPWAEYATVGEKIVGLFEEVTGILVTGVVLAFLSKLWSDILDIVYEFKRFVRGKANATKPEENSARSASGLRRGGGMRGGSRRSRDGGSSRGDSSRGDDSRGEGGRGRSRRSPQSAGSERR